MRLYILLYTVILSLAAYYQVAETMRTLIDSRALAFAQWFVFCQSVAIGASFSVMIVMLSCLRHLRQSLAWTCIVPKL